MARSYDRELPPGSLRYTTACQYCAVGCGYSALLVPTEAEEGERVVVEGISAFVTPAMQAEVNLRGRAYRAAVVPDARCDLNKGNHSVRGGTQGHNLVTSHGRDTSTRERLRSPHVRLADGTLREVDWATATRIVAKLVAHTTGLEQEGDALTPATPNRLGVKVFEYQYLENTYAATKLFYRALGTANVAYHDRPSAAGSSPGMSDAGIGPHDFAYDDIRSADVILMIGSNPYENQSVFFMQNCVGKELIVIDPRRTATAYYALETGGMHLAPKRLGADALVIYALCRALLEQGVELHPNVVRRLTDDVRLGFVKGPGDDAGLRRASRAAGLNEFSAWLGVGDSDSTTYTLENAAEVAGLELRDLRDLVRRLITPPAGGNDRPRVAILYEKGLIWGFNYHNTAAVASLGLVLWPPDQPLPLVGRCGGHQKGWAEARGDVRGFRQKSPEAASDTGYRFGNSVDSYGDERLEHLRQQIPTGHPAAGWGGRLRLNHNLDTHVFGPDTDMRPSAIDDGRVQLANGVETVAEPDVGLLWVIGGNYLGQTHASAWKQQRARDRLSATRGPDTTDEDAVVSALTARIDAGGLVLIHQDIFPNPTTELADVVLPASGWGEDDFVRYNAERRLRLYERFQDPPLHPADAGRGDPLVRRETWKHSPKPDWMIFRDVARQLAEIRGNHDVRQAVGREFGWTSSAELADELAGKLPGELARSNRTAMLAALLDYGEVRGIPEGQCVHTVLGRGGAGDARLLDRYRIPEDDGVHGNRVASNGVFLPLSVQTDAEGETWLHGTLRKPPSGPCTFVCADWEEIAPWFEAIRPRGGELAITCGRVNHLWNNLFHHMRNETIAERYPEDMPGTLLEVNPSWAKAQGLDNGQVVNVRGPRGTCVAVVSLQDSVAEGTAFALFSYPVRDPNTGRFTFAGYANNVMHGYFDGIHPIGALKYGRAKVEPWYRDGEPVYFRSSKRPGPIYAPRNRVVTTERADLRGGLEPERHRWDHLRRMDWRMRELGVIRGLTRAWAHDSPRRQETMLDPDATLAYLRHHLRGVFAMMLDVMRWPPHGPERGRYDRWHGPDLAFARYVWARSVELDEDDLVSPGDPELLERFLTWSADLTGFSDLGDDRAHGQGVLDRLLRRDGIRSELEAFLRGQWPETPELVEAVTVLWYTGTFLNSFGYPDDGFGSMAEDHYRRGLVWRVAGLEPPGYRTTLRPWDSPGEEES